MNYPLVAFTLLCLLWSAMLAEAAQPDAGTILREQRQAPPVVLPDRKIVPEPVKPLGDKKDGIKIKITGFDFEGLTIFSPEELRNELADLVGIELTMEQLEVAPRRIIAFYSKRGRIASAFLPSQEVMEGRVLIKIIEGKLGAVTVDPQAKSRLRSELALRYLLRENTTGANIDKDALESAVRLLKSLPGVSASTTLLPGKERGTSDLVLHLEDTPLISGSLESDNYGSLSSGEYRGAVVINVNNPYGYGDQINTRLQTSFENNYGRLAYTIPIGVSGGRLSLSSSYLHYDLGGELKSKGDAVTGGGSFTYPLIRGSKFNLSGQSGYEFRWLYNEARETPVNNKQLHTGNISLSADLNDSLFGGGFNSLSLTFGCGGVDLSKVSSDLLQDRSGARISGLFGKFAFSASRTQTLIESKTSLSFSVNGQYALNNLDSSEQFGLGGAYAVRAYASGEASGDTGFVASAELRQTLHHSLQASMFYDYGWIRQHENPWSGWNSSRSVPNEYSLDGFGLGLTWTPTAWFMLKGIVATRVQNNRGANFTGKDADGTKREPRFWFQSSISF